MQEQFLRTELILGSAALERLSNTRVAVFGIGGVGGHAADALARGGVGAIDLIDNDRFSVTNINRQIYAAHSTVGRYKTEVAAERLMDINPQIKVTTHNIFYLPDMADEIDLSQYDYVIDAIDTVTGKLALIENAGAAGVPIISSMGTGNKLDPTALEVADIYQTSVCPLARVMRSELKKRGISELKVVYSKEKPLVPKQEAENPTQQRCPGSTSFVPSAAGLIIAGEVIKALIKEFL